MTKGGRKRFILVAVVGVIFVLSFVLSTRLSRMVAVGHDFLFHFGQTFALQTSLGFENRSALSWVIEPIVFNNFGYGTRLFYPPLPHVLPALLAAGLSLVGMTSMLATFRIFIWLCMGMAGTVMFLAARVILKRLSAGFVAALLYMSAPYFLADFFLRSAYGEFLAFIWLPIVILSIYYFYAADYKRFLVAFVPSFTLIIYSHTISILYTAVMVGAAILCCLPRFYRSWQAWKTLLIAGGVCLLLGSPFLVGLMEQRWRGDYAVFDETNMGYTGERAIEKIVPLDIAFTFGLTKAHPAASVTILGGWMILGLAVAMGRWGRIKKRLGPPVFYYVMGGIAAVYLIASMVPGVWFILPKFMLAIQFPYRLHLFSTPIFCLLAATGAVLWSKSYKKTAIALGATTLVWTAHTFWYLGSYKLIAFDSIDYISWAPRAAQGWDYEHLPMAALAHYDELLEGRGGEVLVMGGDGRVATDSAVVIKIGVDEPPYLEMEIENNEEEGVFELPRLYYYGYKLERVDGEGGIIELSEGERGLMMATISGNGKFILTYPGSLWQRLSYMAAGGTLVIIGGVVIYKKKKAKK
ncbi:hypothetical protein FWH30_00480 [Microgenomates group bacterium]|nr:hypothetical protein [Microgenomates group bacterium]